jgi:hypothetical protein
MPLEESPFASVLALEDFERFVYVLSVLERYPAQKCADLLGASTQEILETRIRALQHIAEFANGGIPHRQSVSQIGPKLGASAEFVRRAIYEPQCG